MNSKLKSVMAIAAISLTTFAQAYTYKVTVTPCKGSMPHETVPGKRLQPGNECRVLNYYRSLGNKRFVHVGATAVPLGIEFLVPWTPEVIRAK